MRSAVDIDTLVGMHGKDRRPPGAGASALDWLLYEQSDVLTWRQAVRHLGASQPRRLVATGRWQSPCRGVLVAHNGPLLAPTALWVASLAAGRGALIGGLTAAVEAGLRGFRPTAMHLLIGGRRPYPQTLRRPLDGLPPVIVHRTSCLPREHVQRARPMSTTTARAVVDAAQWAGTDTEARAIVAAACQQRIVSPEEIVAVTEVLPRARRRALTIETATYAKGGAQALSEINLVRLCARFALPRPDQQARRTDASGRTRYLDAFWRDFKLQVEVDGSHHMDVRQWEADMRRQNDVWLSGERILRFSAWQVRHEQAYVAGQIRAALVAAGWRP